MYQRNQSSYHPQMAGNKGHFGNVPAEQNEAQQSNPIPRVSADMLHSFCNQTVALFGRAIGVDHDNRKVHVQCPISGETLILPVVKTANPDEELQFSVHNEFILEVGRSPKELTLLDHTSLTDNFDFEAYGRLMRLMWDKDISKLFH
uniref:Uncharacterized protein n=1 Tax=Paramoeba aestuarina TaxID=180227 RepID=A0A7S4KFG7_9EUKA|mmetsp:Transcript_18171/g.28470  ORF Transcript_18171/g.28470 Transcript_18171/m.28470 type:complete len:147 (+) Transcript_18171:33-473(+)